MSIILDDTSFFPVILVRVYSSTFNSYNSPPKKAGKTKAKAEVGKAKKGKKRV